MYVLEAVLLAMILLGAAYAVSTLQDPSLELVRPRSELERVVRDALVVLEGLGDGNGTSLLDRYLLEALHCAEDPTPSSTDCESRRSKNLSVKLESYLPLGSGYAIGLANGAATREIYRSPLPMGEAVSTSLTFVPEWNTTFAFTEFSCYDDGAPAVVTLIPIDKGNVTHARYNNVTALGVEYEGARARPSVPWGPAYTARWWNATIPSLAFVDANGDGRKDPMNLSVNATANATLNGTTVIHECDRNALDDELADALHASTFDASALRVSVGSSMSFSADLGPIDALLGVGVTIREVHVALYEPVAPRNMTPDTWLPAGLVELTDSGVRTGTWTPAPDALYGAHPALLRVGVSVAGVDMELRRAIVVDVALASGEVPFDPPYRASLQAWMADWG